MLELTLRVGSVPAILLYDETGLTDDEWLLIERSTAGGAATRAVASDILVCLSVRKGPLGCVSAVRIAETGLSEVALRSQPLLIVTEGLEKPGNLGSLVRTASAAGADALIAADSHSDVFAPAALHASLGAVFDLPVVRCSSPAALQWLRANSIAVVATSPAAKSAYYELDLTRPVAIAIGNEYRGLSPAWLESGVRTCIPMTGSMNSLNATVAGGIVLFEALRQRAIASAPAR